MSSDYRRLRNGLLHLGVSAVPVNTARALALDDVVRHYTGTRLGAVVEVVDGALEGVCEHLEGWCMTAPLGDANLATVLHKP